MAAFSSLILRCGISSVYVPSSQSPAESVLSHKTSPNETEMSSGTGSSAADLEYMAARTLTTGSSENLDLAGGLTDRFGTTLTFAKIKAIYIENPSTNSTSISFKPGSSNGWVGGPIGTAAHTVTIPAGGKMFFSAPVSGWTVTAGTGDIINIANSAGASNTYILHIIGTSA